MTRRVTVGESFSQVHRFTPEAVSAFSHAMGDTNPLHHDAKAAAGSRYKQLIVSGTHTTALLLGLTASHFSKRSTVVGVAFGVRLKRPVFASAEVTLQWTVTKVVPHRSGNGELVDLIGSLTDESGTACVTATGTVLVGLDAADEREVVR